MARTSYLQKRVKKTLINIIDRICFINYILHNELKRGKKSILAGQYQRFLKNFHGEQPRTQYILRCFDEIEMSKANGYKIH